MKYYIGDIVEILTSKYKSYQDVPNHEIVRFLNQGEDVPFIGQRFRVYYIAADSMIYNKNGKTDMQMRTRPDNLILYRRPLKNWIKYWLDLK